jgi:hypothetical protein
MTASTTTMIRVDRGTHELLRKMANHEQLSLTDMIKRTAQEYERQQFWREANAEFAALRADESAWEEYQSEVLELDGALSDGRYPYWAGRSTTKGLPSECALAATRCTTCQS